MPEPTKRTERTKCEYCHQMQVCDLVRKPKRILGFVFFPLVRLCIICRYNVTTL